MTLEDVLSRLQQHDSVVGILLMGTTGTGAHTSTSDFDILLVLREIPVAARLVATWIDGRLAEIYCTTAAAVERVTADPGTWAAGSDEEALIRWMRAGRIVYDQTGALRSGHVAASSVQPAVLDDAAAYWGWWGIGYNVAHMRRYAWSNDAVSQAAAQLRLTWSIFQVVAHYFTMRKLPWRGEKEAVSYFTANDPEYLELLQRCLAEVHVIRKAQLYEQLARLTLEPVGGLWTNGSTAVELGRGFGTGDVMPRPSIVAEAEEVLAWWRALISDTTSVPPTLREQPHRVDSL